MGPSLLPIIGGDLKFFAPNDVRHELSTLEVENLTRHFRSRAFSVGRDSVGLVSLERELLDSVPMNVAMRESWLSLLSGESRILIG